MRLSTIATLFTVSLAACGNDAPIRSNVTLTVNGTETSRPITTAIWCSGTDLVAGSFNQQTGGTGFELGIDTTQISPGHMAHLPLDNMGPLLFIAVDDSIVGPNNGQDVSAFAANSTGLVTIRALSCELGAPILIDFDVTLHSEDPAESMVIEITGTLDDEVGPGPT